MRAFLVNINIGNSLHRNVKIHDAAQFASRELESAIILSRHVILLCWHTTKPVSWIIRLRKLVDTLCPHIIKIVCLLLLYRCHLIFVTVLNPCRSQNQCFDLRFLSTFTNWNTIRSFCQIPQRLRYQTLGERNRRSPHFFPPMKPTDFLDLSYLKPVDEKACISAIASVRAAVASTTNMESLLAQLQSIPTLLEFILSGKFFWISIAWLYIKTTQPSSKCS